MLLARAAAYARHRDYFTVLFNAQTMEPRIDGPPFVRALEELVAAVGAHHQTAGRLTPTDTLGELLAGRCALAIGWLPPAGYGLQASGTGNEAPKPEARSPKSVADVACVPLPGARESFDWDQKAYEPGALRRVPLLACEGRYASVTARAEHPAAARELLSALASGEWAVRASSPSAATTVFRGSQVEEAERWTSVDRSVATAYAKSVGESLDTQDVMYALRIPGREEYLAALDKAVRAAVSGRQKPQAVLTAAAAEWRAITGKLGVTSQRTACERSDVRIEH
jgi:multiple sugar transport system substrate-binding protein